MWSIPKISGSCKTFKLVKTVDCNILPWKYLMSNLFGALSKHLRLSFIYEKYKGFWNTLNTKICINMGVFLNIISKYIPDII